MVAKALQLTPVALWVAVLFHEPFKVQKLHAILAASAATASLGKHGLCLSEVFSTRR